MGYGGPGQGALRVVEYNGTGAIGVVDDATRARGLPSALPGPLRHVHAPLPEVSHQEAWWGSPSQGKGKETQIRDSKWPGPSRPSVGSGASSGEHTGIGEEGPALGAE